MEEYFDVLSEKGEYTGKIESRKDCHKLGLWHRAVVVFIISLDNQKVLLQKRSATKRMWPNLWDVTAGGHVLSGELGYESVIREAKEEIGITVKEEDLVFLAVNHHYQADHVQLFFSTNSYEGEPTVCESQECGGLLWANLDNLPENTIPYVANVIEDIKLGIQFDDGDFVNLKSRKAKKII